MNLFGKGRRATTLRINTSVVLTIVLSFCAAVSLTAFNSSYIAENGLYKNGAPVICLVLLALVAIGAAIFGALNMSSHADGEILPKHNYRAMTIISFITVALFVSVFAIYFLLGALDLQYGVGHGIAYFTDLVEKMKWPSFVIECSFRFRFLRASIS